MATEIEHKFLLCNDDWKNHVTKKTFYVQAYLSKDPNRTTRIRIAGDKAYLTIKGQAPKDTPLETPEFEYEIPKKDAEKLLPLCLPGKIEKTRHIVEHAGHIWEIDVFHGENDGLILAEIEVPTSDTTFDIPDWIGANVTSDARYKNSALSEKPFKTWGLTDKKAPKNNGLDV